MRKAYVEGLRRARLAFKVSLPGGAARLKKPPAAGTI